MVLTPCELRTPCVFDDIAAHCAMHPNIIIQMITTSCELQTPCVFDVMAAHCAMHPNIIIQMLTTPCELQPPCVFRCHGNTQCAMHSNIIIRMITTQCELQAPCVFDALAAHWLCHASKHNHPDDYHTMRITNSTRFRCLGNTLCHASNHNHPEDYNTMRVTNSMCSRCHGGTLCHASKHSHSDDYSIMRVTNSMCFRCHGNTLCHASKHYHSDDCNTMRVRNSMCFRCHGSTLCHASKHNHSDGYNTMRAVTNSMCFRCRGSTLCLAFNIIIQMITTPCELQAPWVFDALAAHCAMHPKHNHSDDYSTMRITNSMCVRCHGSTLCHASKHNHSDDYNSMRVIPPCVSFWCRAAHCAMRRILNFRWLQHYAGYKLHLFSMPWQRTEPCIQHNHSDDYNSMRVTNSMCLDLMPAHCAMHPNIIIGMITTPCELQTPCVSRWQHTVSCTQT